MLRHAMSTDLTGMVTAQPFFIVRFEVAQGIQLAVDGKPVQMTNGIYSHMVPLDSATATGSTAGDNIIYKVPFQLTDLDGSTEQGQHVVTIPLTKLRVDRPADGAIVALDTVTCSGEAEEGATVTVNGQAVGVTTAGFNSSAPLEAIGEHTITIVARAPGRAPRTETIKVTRIQSLDTAIEEWSRDLDKSLDYPTLARDPNQHSGKKALFEGRVEDALLVPSALSTLPLEARPMPDCSQWLMCTAVFAEHGM